MKTLVDPVDVLFFAGTALAGAGLWWRFGADLALIFVGVMFAGTGLGLLILKRTAK